MICLFLYSESGEATLGIALDWVVEMAWFLFLVYVCGFPTIYHNLVLIPPAVVTRRSPLSQVIPHRCVCNSSPVSLSHFSLFQIMVLLDEAFQMVYFISVAFLSGLQLLRFCLVVRIFACLVSTQQYMCIQLFIIQTQ
ncbi:hypothetical protein BKA82DRAFT_4156770 [Pisolithus tinctorius]|nr:hypothetical protein BKA82DRAFT_4156770 [Pisolithus tinctorius]